MLMLEATTEERDTSSATQLPQALHRGDCGSPARHPLLQVGPRPALEGLRSQGAAMGREHLGTRLSGDLGTVTVELRGAFRAATQKALGEVGDGGEMGVQSHMGEGGS